MANTFRRTENKYLLEPDQWRPMLTLLRENMQSDAFDDGDGYNVCNIYYDNANNTLIRASVSKPLYKEKLRVRSYGVPDDGSKVYVEVKKKTKGVVSKRRISMRLRDVEPFLICGVIPPDLTEASLQIAKELLYMQSIYRAVPKLYLAYRRFAFTGIEDERLRVTIDVDILTRRDDLKLESGIYGESLIGDKAIMEVKFIGQKPIWLTRAMYALGIRKTSFSKYGTEYAAFRRAQMEDHSVKGPTGDGDA